MRLLHVKELRLEEFFDDYVPPYATLSHRWGQDEVSYQDFMNGRKRNGAGYKKILDCCKYVAADLVCIEMGFEYIYSERVHPETWRSLWSDDWVWVDRLDWVWIDTCCIDKSSSAELSEAINSMYRWYAESQCCYVHLSDVKKSNYLRHTLIHLRNSLWFTRGWTLQELLAPKNVILLDKDWKELGAKSDLLDEIAYITGIAKERLEPRSSGKASRIAFAELVSWASDRKTAREEDGTYCLLGLCGINMPLLYGEREKAFLRLQLEVIRSSNDESIFIWQRGLGGRMGLIARFPREFASSRGAQKGEFSKIEGLQRPPYAVTNQGLQFEVPAELSEMTSFLLPLNCRHFEGAQLKGAYAIHIVKDVSSGIWIRTHPRNYPQNMPQDVTVYRHRHGGLFIVPIEWVWSLEDLTRVSSKIIYLSIQ